MIPFPFYQVADTVLLLTCMYTYPIICYSLRYIYFTRIHYTLTVSTNYILLLVSRNLYRHPPTVIVLSPLLLLDEGWVALLLTLLT